MEPTSYNNVFPLGSHLRGSTHNRLCLTVALRFGLKSFWEAVFSLFNGPSTGSKLRQWVPSLILTYFTSLPDVRLGSGSPPRTELPHAHAGQNPCGASLSLAPLFTPTLSCSSFQHQVCVIAGHVPFRLSKPLTGCGILWPSSPTRLHASHQSYPRGSKPHVISVSCSPMCL